MPYSRLDAELTINSAMDQSSTQHPTSTNMNPIGDSVPELRGPFERRFRSAVSSQLHTAFGKADPQAVCRRESLLTRQLHSETEHTDEDDMAHAPRRALSTQSTWSNPSVASTAELTSDDGHSVASPAISPPLPPTTIRTTVPIIEKALVTEPRIFGHEGKRVGAVSEQSVEAGLGRKRCISFACGNRDKKSPTSQPAPPATQQSSASPPKRKCMLKFACPTRSGSDTRPTGKHATATKRPISPPPPQRRTSKSEAVKAHRGSDSTVTHASPKSVRKLPAVNANISTTVNTTVSSLPRRRMSNDSNCSTEATRFHEFASSDDEPEEWVQEVTCHRSRLTVSDTLQKENVIRKACEEVEEEAVQEEEDEEDELEDELDLDDDDDDDEDDDDVEEEEESDDGFHTDDEEGFADTDSEAEESDEEWWRPGGPSTAATSIDQLERFTLSTREDAALSSSVGSASSAGHTSAPRPLVTRAHRKLKSTAVPIHNRRETHELPDSTDFVCGTLDEDRPLEQAFLNHLKQKEAAKHIARPQDIDPTFPTSDPEMDDEDDEDLEVPAESEHENLMHGEMEELNGRRGSLRPRTRSNTNRSPPPPTNRHRSPAPAALRRAGTARSPPPTRRHVARSPPPPRNLFGRSPVPSRSPAPSRKLPSPPNTRRASPATLTAQNTHVLASRPQLTHTASLPRGGFMLGKINDHRGDEDDGSDTAGNNVTGGMTKRGAIDIFKGLEKKRQRRKEKIFQKACARAAAKGEKAYKVKPGKGAERMREVGLELQRYQGKGVHILSL